ncbi:protein DD3-3-like [Clavelina lepadiformis]|uniref:protein DD3-3-like n=1 Tax=Clavelina lepadiformis TaxID=159417 RepID=UPI004040EE72
MAALRHAFLTCLILKAVYADIYMHNPRGSNNRWNENGRNRNNANRMFDSQNNNRGGYNVGSVYFHVGSNVQIEWTNQHSCGDQNNHCDTILQYTCGNLVRDGTTTSTIPDNPAQCENLDCNEDRRYGMHEDYFYYADCKLRSRNKGLYTADRNVGSSATKTRQNQNGNRFGYECPEERDYYPYWGPTPWRDIAVLTNDVTRCAMYQEESQNVKGRYACKVGMTYLYQNSNKNPSDYIPITQRECEAFKYTENNEEKYGVWTLYDPHGIPAPDCVVSQWSRDNHLGNGIGGETLNYNWTVPDFPNDHCTLRIRYNITTFEFDRDNTTSLQNNRVRNDGPGPDVWSRHGLSESDGKNRGYELEGNPEINIFGLENDKLNLRLAINTAQYGRTFQDRSHTFAIVPRPEDIPENAVIQNIQVRGKRGNIVQVYPAVEYDFVPNGLVMTVGSYAHFQWTGSDNNPANNDGQGRASTDRSNVVMLGAPVYVEGNPELYKTSTFGQLGRSYPSHLSDATLAGLSDDDKTRLAILYPHRGGDMVELDDAGTYFDLGPRKVTMTGTFNYMCTRNNNFSNRSQKGRIIGTTSIYSQARIDSNGGKVTVQDSSDNVVTSVEVPSGSLTEGKSIQLVGVSAEEVSLDSLPPNTDFISEFVRLEPENEITNHPTELLKMEIKLNDDVTSLYEPNLYRSNADTTSWEKLEIDSHENGRVVFSTRSGGHYVVAKTVAAGPMAGLVIGLIVGVVLIVGIIVLVRKNGGLLQSYKSKV